MSRKRFLTILLVCSTVTIVGSLGASADTVYVHPTEGAYHTIASGVGVAAAGDTVLVGPGNYGSFTVDKRLTIISEEGPDMTKIRSGASVTFVDGADGSLISGFTNVSGIRRFSTITGRFDSAVFDEEDELRGTDFPINPGEGYFIFMKEEMLNHSW